MVDHEPSHEQERGEASARETRAAYQSIYRRLDNIRQTEALWDKRAMKRNGIIDPVKIYPPFMAKGTTHNSNPLCEKAMDRFWAIGTIDDTGRADTELRRAYHLLAKGKAPVTESDLIELGQLPAQELRALLPWLAHRMSLKEARESVAGNLVAPPVVIEETT